MAPLDLTRPRDLGDLLRTTLELWSRHLPVALALTAAVVAPTYLVLELATGAITGAGDASVGALLAVVVLALGVQAVATVFGVRIVLAEERGEAVGLGVTAREGLAALPAVLAVIAVYSVGVAVATLLIVPGVWLAVRWAFAPQRAMVDGDGTGAALSGSAALVQGRWWRTFGVLLVLIGLPTLLAGLLQAVLATVSDTQGAVLLTAVVTDTLAISFSALAATLAFFDLRARTRVPAGPAPLVTPERPGPQPGWGG
jgi:hypothetical protein